jgi:hypothetical protein
MAAVLKRNRALPTVLRGGIVSIDIVRTMGRTSTRGRDKVRIHADWIEHRCSIAARQALTVHRTGESPIDKRMTTGDGRAAIRLG